MLLTLAIILNSEEDESEWVIWAVYRQGRTGDFIPGVGWGLILRKLIVLCFMSYVLQFFAKIKQKLPIL